LKRLIITALPDEARPFIDRFRLASDENQSDLRVFSNETCSLLITGIGGNRVKSVLPVFLERISDFDNAVLFNIGIAGGHPDKTEIGEVYLVNKVNNDQTVDKYSLTIPVKNGFNTMALTTVVKGITAGHVGYEGLVDMEAAIITATAVSYLNIDKIAVIKVVSDHMDIDDWSSLDVYEIIRSKLDSICALMELYV
jgi:purine nucleoside permease|tara:strand:- start:736 stop:1323 length:588 start_codon:yes stop_codon:yes gene_type:complete